MNELETLFDAIQDEDEELVVSVEVGRAIPRAVAGAMPASEQVENVLAGHTDASFVAETVDVARQATVGTTGERSRNVAVSTQTEETSQRKTNFLRQVEVAQSKVARSAGLRGAVSSLSQRVMQSANDVSHPLDWSNVPLGVDRAMERDARRYDGGF